MRHEASLELFRHWDRVRKHRATPERDDIDPAAIRSVLADTFLLDPGRDGQFRIRLSGTRLDALWLGDLKGRSFLDLWGDDRHSVAAALWTVMDGACPVIMGARTGPTGRMAANVEVLVLPLRYHGKTHERMLGALTLAETPPWIGLLPVERLRLVSLRIIEGEAATGLPMLTPPPEEDFVRVERRGHLTVYSGGRAADPG
jgi:hypothetical protein